MTTASNLNQSKYFSIISESNSQHVHSETFHIKQKTYAHFLSK